LLDPLFGLLDYDYGWNGRCSWTIYGREVVTTLHIPCDDGDVIAPAQREAFAAFEARKDAMVAAAETAIFEHYLDVAPDYRLQFGPDHAARAAPEVNSPAGMATLVTPTETIVQRSFADPPERIIGLMFDCTWEPSLGLAVKFVDERLVETGPQDIVL
jgi:hypothetical protein